jgi:hypothetical protein
MDYGKMNAKLFDALMSDLSDPEKTTPQLYKVVLDVLKENRDSIEITDRNVDKLIEEKIDLPFKFGTG